MITALMGEASNVGEQSDTPNCGSTKCETINFVEPREKSMRNWPKARVVSSVRARGSEMLREELCARLTTLNEYGLGRVGRALVDGLFALAVRSRHAIRAGVAAQSPS